MALPGNAIDMLHFGFGQSTAGLEQVLYDDGYFLVLSHDLPHVCSGICVCEVHAEGTRRRIQFYKDFPESAILLHDRLPHGHLCPLVCRGDYFLRPLAHVHIGMLIHPDSDDSAAPFANNAVVPPILATHPYLYQRAQHLRLLQHA